MTQPSDAPAMLAAAAAALYPDGDRRTMLANALKVQRRSVRLWLSGHTEINESVWGELLYLLEMRERDLRAARAKLYRWLSPGESSV
jgi:hypothetical protein